VINDIGGCSDSLNKQLYIQVDGPTANFVVNNTGSCLMSAINFTDNSASDGTHPITSWVWDYGDGVIETLTAPPFQHLYSTPGIYQVKLVVVDSKGCTDTLLNPNQITISKPVAAFSSADTVSCPGKTIHFTNASTGPGLTYTWDFGDGTTSAATNPNHIYAADGVYTVRLIVADQYGCGDSLTRSTYVRIASPHANFNLSDSVATCPPLFVNFTNTSSNFISVLWKFGDGTSTNSDNPSHFYSTPGTYHPRLIITSPGGCQDSVENEIIVRGPQGTFTYGPLGGCKPLTVNFNATTHDRLSFIWDFNDGTVTGTIDSIMSHTYTIPGRYVPKMILIDPNGCQVPITGADTIVVKGVTTNFNFNNSPICDKGSVNFTDASTGNDPITNYAWSFGDGGTSTSQNPTHYYAASGTYFPQLAVTTQSGCVDTMRSTTPVKIVASPQADFASSGNGCVPLTALFNATLLVPDTSAISWQWMLGNGNTSTVQSPLPQQYINAAVYNIRLIATNSTGCKDTVDKTVEAYLVPTINAGLDTLVCRGSGTTLTATGAATYVWTPSTGLNCTNCANPVASPVNQTSYVVTGTTAEGCSNID
ncbi:MAG TPA: PKD domain-containing protein, partial [Ferruginibacter sp.]|nr:PKD domain-containing protein [Ferruginibacter sp.]